MLRGGAVRSAHRLHGPEDAGSNPAPASISDVETKKLSCPEGGKAASLRASITEKRMNDGKLGHLGLFLDPSAQPPNFTPLRNLSCGVRNVEVPSCTRMVSVTLKRVLFSGCFVAVVDIAFLKKSPGALPDHYKKV